MLARINKSYVPAYWDDYFNDSFFNNFATGHKNFTAPSVNILEENSEFQIEFAVPGLSKKEIKIELDNDLLTVSYENSENKKETKRNYLKREFNYSSFKRSFQMPDNIDSENIKAIHSEGILKISIPKKEETVSKAQRSIEIS